MAKNEYPDSVYLRSLAVRAGCLAKSRFNTNVKQQIKPDGSLVTLVDTTVNDLVIITLKHDFPHISVLAEERDRKVEGAEYKIFCDPLDGTTAFCVGIPFFTFCISVLQGDSPLVAVIFDPMMDRMWHSTKGEGAFENDSRISVSGHSSVRRAKVSCVSWANDRFNLSVVRQRLMDAGTEVVSPQSIAYMGGLLASGRIEATVFGVRRHYETVAMHLLVEEAGGKATDIFGDPLVYSEDAAGGKGHIISNGKIHGELVELVRNCQKEVRS